MTVKPPLCYTLSVGVYKDTIRTLQDHKKPLNNLLGTRRKRMKHTVHMIAVCIVTLTVFTLVIPVVYAQEATSENTNTYRSLRDLLNAIPPDIQPHKVGFFSNKNSLLEERLQDWLKANAYRHRISFRQRELLSIDQQAGVWSILIADDSVSLGGMRYDPRTIRCLLDITVENEARYKRLQSEGTQPADVPYEEYRQQQEQRSARIKETLLKLRPREEKGGRIVQSGSRINVLGTITRIETNGSYINQRPPYVVLTITVDQVEI